MNFSNNFCFLEKIYKIIVHFDLIFVIIKNNKENIWERLLLS